MKKNILLRLFFCMLVCVLYPIHTSAISYNYGILGGVSTSTGFVQLRFDGIASTTRFNCLLETFACMTTTEKMPSSYTLVDSPDAIKEKLYLQSIGATGIVFSPLSDFVAYSQKATTTNDRFLYVKKVGSDKKVTLSMQNRKWDLLTEQNKLFVFSPDESYLAYIDDFDMYPSLNLLKIKVADKEIMVTSMISKKGQTVDDFTFGSNNQLVFSANTKEHQYMWKLYAYTVSTKKTKTLDNHIASGVSVDRVADTRYVVYYKMIDNVRYPKIYDTRTLRTESFYLPDWLQKKSINAEIKVYVNPKTTGILLLPQLHTKTKKDLIIWLHGGPYRQTSWGYHSFKSYAGFDAVMNELNDTRYILKLDYTGSYGAGLLFADAIRTHVGDLDVADVRDAVTYMKKRYSISNIYVMGNSYGGYLALKSLAEKDIPLSGGISINGVTDWQSFLDTMKPSGFAVHFDLDGQTSSKLLEESSIVGNIQNVVGKKVLLLHGTKDTSVPTSQSVMLQDIFIKNGVDSQLVLFEGENHVYTQKDTIVSMCKKISVFLGETSTMFCEAN